MIASISLSLSDLLTLVFYLVVFAYIIFAFVLHYHWKEYALSANVTRLTYILFFSASVPLLAVMGLIVLIT